MSWKLGSSLMILMATTGLCRSEIDTTAAVTAINENRARIEKLPLKMQYTCETWWMNPHVDGVASPTPSLTTAPMTLYRHGTKWRMELTSPGGMKTIEICDGSKVLRLMSSGSSPSARQSKTYYTVEPAKRSPANEFRPESAFSPGAASALGLGRPRELGNGMVEVAMSRDAGDGTGRGLEATYVMDSANSYMVTSSTIVTPTRVEATRFGRSTRFSGAVLPTGSESDMTGLDGKLIRKLACRNVQFSEIPEADESRVFDVTPPEGAIAQAPVPAGVTAGMPPPSQAEIRDGYVRTVRTQNGIVTEGRGPQQRVPRPPDATPPQGP